MENEQKVTEEQQVNFETSEVGTMENEQEITEEQVNFETSEVGTMENEQEVTEEQDCPDYNINGTPTSTMVTEGPPTEKSKTISTEASSKKEQLPRLFNDIPEYNKSYCRTQYTSKTIECKWEIVDFSKLYKLMKTFVTAPFPEKEESQIQIQIEISSFKDPSDDIIEFYILTKTEFAGFYNIYQVGPEGKQPLISESTFLKDMMLLYKTKMSTFMKNTYADLLIMNFKFDIFYNANISVVLINSLPFSITKYSESQISISDNDPKFDNKESITFIIDGEHYSISKNLLCATNSSYFKLLCNAEVDVTDKLIITDKSGVFKEMLSFIMINDSLSKLNLDVWERRLKESDIIIKDLLIIADKYDVKNLKFLCEQSLLRDITTENALELMQIAIQSDAKCLEKFVRGFITIHIEILRNKQLLSLPQEQMNKIIELINKNEVSEFSETV